LKNTLVVNLFGGPGTGKSTGAAYIFSKLKMAGVDAELVTEFAKDKVWEENKEVFKNQFYILGKQSFRLSRCYGKVDVIITDSPLPLSTLYVPTADYTENFRKATVDLFNTYNNLNFFLKRVKEYNPNGRNQTEFEANIIEASTEAMLNNYKIDYETINGFIDGYDYIYEKVMEIEKQLGVVQ